MYLLAAFFDPSLDPFAQEGIWMSSCMLNKPGIVDSARPMSTFPAGHKTLCLPVLPQKSTDRGSTNSIHQCGFFIGFYEASVVRVHNLLTKA